MQLRRWFIVVMALFAGAPVLAAAPAESVVENEPYVLLDHDTLQELVAPIALYPDDLLALVLPASTTPLQIVQASRFLEARKSDATRQPDDSWEEPILALLNYPEALALLNDDLDWTWRLGEAVVYQEAEVLAAVTAFRELARDAGHLDTDERQVVRTEGEHIRIEPVDREEIYIPYYDPAEIIRPVRTTRVYRYYPDPYPVYYYPYRYNYRFPSDRFWGVSSWYGIGWSVSRLHRLHYQYEHHPYYGHSYRHHNYYYSSRPYSRFGYGRFDSHTRWLPRYRHGARPGRYRDRHRYDEGFRDQRRARTQQRVISSRGSQYLRRPARVQNPEAAPRNQQRRDMRRRAESVDRSRQNAAVRSARVQQQRARRATAPPRTAHRDMRSAVREARRNAVVPRGSATRPAQRANRVTNRSTQQARASAPSRPSRATAPPRPARAAAPRRQASMAPPPRVERGSRRDHGARGETLRRPR